MEKLLEVSDLHVAFPSKRETVRAVDGVSFQVFQGETFGLVGESGCGKSTTLRMIAGFEEITKGELYMDGRVVNDIAPGERNIAMVFQSYALFPHLSVWDNITFGLQLQKLPQAEMEKRARMAMEILHLEGYENKKTHELSWMSLYQTWTPNCARKHVPSW